jgi:hypothetical protein
MNAFLLMTARLYAPLSTAAYLAEAELRLRAACPQSVKHEARLTGE